MFANKQFVQLRRALRLTEWEPFSLYLTATGFNQGMYSLACWLTTHTHREREAHKWGRAKLTHKFPPRSGNDTSTRCHTGSQHTEKEKHTHTSHPGQINSHVSSLRKGKPHWPRIHREREAQMWGQGHIDSHFSPESWEATLAQDTYTEREADTQEGSGHINSHFSPKSWEQYKYSLPRWPTTQ